jgi:hypothetical protein
MTSLVSRNCNPASAASPLWSITAKTFRSLAAAAANSRVTVSATDHGLNFVTTSSLWELVDSSWILVGSESPVDVIAPRSVQHRVNCAANRARLSYVK